MKRKNLLLLCVIAMVAICLASCGLVENLPGSDSLPGCVELFGSHNVTHVDAKDATCTEAGNIEYWYCNSCGTVWSDSANTQQITKESTVVAQLEHEYTYACDQICVHCGELTNEEAEHTIAHVNAKDATCAEPGNIEYWYCTDCGYAWADAALTKVTNLKSVIIPELECNTVHFEAVAPACHYNGNIEYWVCYDCERVWQDEALTQLTNIKNVVLPATGNGLLVHMEATEAGCHSNGCIEHWICYTCEQVWQDEALTQLTNIKNVIIPAKGSDLLVHMDAVAPGCHYTGIVEHWICYECEGVWTDEALTQVSNVKNVIIPELGGDVVHVEAKDPTCNELGNIEYWYCETCEQVWQDEARTQLTNFKNVKLGTIDHEYFYACDGWCMNCYEFTNPEATHTLIHVDAVEATCQATGNIEYWTCTDCGGCWDNENATGMPLNRRMVITYVDHEYFYACDGMCILCYEITNPDAAHNIVFVPAVEATCQTTGNIAYYTCTECGGCWDNENATGMPLNRMMVKTWAECTAEYACESKCKWCFATLETEGHKATLVPAVASTCTKNGNIAHYTCEHCGKLWYDKALTQTLSKNEVTLPLAAHEYRFECDAHCMNCYELTNEYAYHNIVLVEAKAPTCIAFGNIEHYACTYCAGCWDNAEGTGMPLNKMMVNISKVEHEALSPCYPECKWCFQPVFETNGHDVKHVEAKDKTCLEAGCLEHWICANCNTVWVDEALTETVRYADVMIPTLGYHSYNFECDTVCSVCLLETRPESTHEYVNKCDKVCMYCYEITNPNADHTIAHVEAVDPVCHQTGNVEYWYCTDCGIAWTDETLRYQTNLRNVIIPALNELTYVAEVPASCHQNGCQEYWFCEVCDAVFADAAGIQLTNRKNLTLVYTADIIHIEAVEAACHYTGLVEHWYCSDCNAVFTDAALTQLTNHKSVIIPATGKGDLVHFDAVAPGCHDNGNIEYWVCYTCEQVWQNEALTQLTNIKNVILPATGEGNLVHFDAVAPACHYDGNIEYWVCYTCEKVWANEALTQLTNIKNVILPAVGGEITHVAAKAPGCETLGNIEYWYCEECEQVWQNEALTQLTNFMSVKIGSTGHNYKATVTAPTCTKVGYTTYTCLNCDDEYVDDEVPTTDHTGLEGDFKCNTCSTIVYPADGTTLTIKEALVLAGYQAHNTYTKNKYYITGYVTGLYNTTYGNMYLKDLEGNEICIYGLYTWGNGTQNGTRYDKMTYKPVNNDELTVYTVLGMYYSTAQGKNAWVDECIPHVCSEYTDATCKKLAACVVCGKTTGELADHNYVDGVCSVCGSVEGGNAFETILPSKLTFTSLANKASADTYLKNNYSDWTISGKLGNGYAGYLGFGRSGDNNSSIKSSEISVNSAFTVKAVLKGNGSSGVATSTLTFTLVDANGNIVATGYAKDATVAAITPVDGKDTTYNISFTFVEGKTWTDVSALVISFAKQTGNIGMKSLEFVQ